MPSSQDFPTSLIGKRLKAFRKLRGLSAERLAEKMREVGVPFDSTVTANLETGRRRFVSVQELLALAFVLDVSPIHLLVPNDDAGEPYQVLPTLPTSQRVVRRWIAGRGPLYGQDFNKYVSSVPSTDPDGFWDNFPALREEFRKASDGER